MDPIDSLSPARKKSPLAITILLIITLIITGFLRLTGFSEADMAASVAPGAQSVEEDPQSDIPQSATKTVAPQSGESTNESGSLATDAEATGQATFAMSALQDAYTDPKQARATDLSSVLTASMLEESDTQAPEWTRNGTRAIGSPTPEDMRILSDDGVGNVMVSACIGSPNVRIPNDAGTAPASDTTVTRALTYFPFVKNGDVRKLSDPSSPDDPTC